MKKIIIILILILTFCNIIFLYAAAWAKNSSSQQKMQPNKSNYNVYKPNEYSSKIPDPDKEKIMFIVDFSNSMNEYMGSKRKIDVALYALKEILPNIPKTAQIGLRVYGYRGGITPVDACMASKLVVPIDYDNFDKIYYELNRVAPTGMTPITYSIKQSLKNDFGLWQGKKRIIVLTDGGENCDESPCNYAIKLISKRNDVQIDVIAFSVDDKNAIDQLRCASLVTNGKFYNVETYGGLMNSLNETFNTEKSVEGVIVE